MVESDNMYNDAKLNFEAYEQAPQNRIRHLLIFLTIVIILALGFTLIHAEIFGLMIGVVGGLYWMYLVFEYAWRYYVN